MSIVRSVPSGFFPTFNLRGMGKRWETNSRDSKVIGGEDFVLASGLTLRSVTSPITPRSMSPLKVRNTDRFISSGKPSGYRSGVTLLKVQIAAERLFPPSIK